MTPFDFFKQDLNEVILLIDYYQRKNKNTTNKPLKTNARKEERIRVNDKTATGGWF